MDKEPSQKPDYISAGTWKRHLNTWCSDEEIDSDVVEIHKVLIKRVTLAIVSELKTVNEENIIYCGFSIKDEDGHTRSVVWPFVIFSSDISYNTINKECTLSWSRCGGHTLIMSKNKFFSSTATGPFNEAKAVKMFVERQNNAIVNEHKDKWRLGVLLDCLDKRIESEDFLDFGIYPPEKEYSNESKVLRSILHCELVAIDELIRNDESLDSVISGFEKEGSKPITEIRFHIHSFKDMCPRCFSVCCVRKKELLDKVSAILRDKEFKITDNVQYKVYVSSHKEYIIPELKYSTGVRLSSSLCSETNIYQFRDKKYYDESCKEIQSVIEKRKTLCEKIDFMIGLIEMFGLYPKPGISDNVLLKEEYYKAIYCYIVESVNSTIMAIYTFIKEYITCHDTPDIKWRELIEIFLEFLRDNIVPLLVRLNASIVELMKTRVYERKFYWKDVPDISGQINKILEQISHKD